MWSSLKALDRILRGESTRPGVLAKGTVEVPAGGLSAVIVLLGLVYGVCMGSFAVSRPGGPVPLQVVSSAIKVPALFILTLLVTFPSLYVSNALVGSRLTLGALLRLMVAGHGVLMAVLASLGPIVAFFSVITTSYPFIVLLNVAVFTVSGFLGVSFLLQTLQRLSRASWVEEAHSPSEPADGPDVLDEAPTGALDRIDPRPYSRHVKTVFACWMVLFGLVGAQMGWVLRPFIGNPNAPFVWLRPRQSNFFEAVIRTFVGLFS